MNLPHLSTKLITAPVNPAVSLSDAKDFLRVTTSDDDALITSLILAATKMVENYLNRFLITQTHDVFYDFIPQRTVDSRDGKGSEPWWDGTREGPVSIFQARSDFLQLPYGPVQSVTTFKTYNISNVVSTFDSSNYHLDNASDSARIALNDTSEWPSDLRARNAIEIRVVYGYGDDADDIPSDIVTAIKLILTPLYESRGCGDASMPKLAMALLDPYSNERLD